MTERNVWREGATEETVEAMRLCGCESRYVSGAASDFERFEELLRVLPLLQGHLAANRFKATLGKMCGRELTDEYLIPENAKLLWRACHSENNGDILAELVCRSDNKCDEKYKKENIKIVLNDTDTSYLSYDEFVRDMKDILTEVPTDVFVRFSENGFIRPSEYAARLAYRECRKLKDDIILYQLLCEIFCDGECRKTQIYADYGKDYEKARQHVAFLKKHNMRASIHVLARPDDDVCDVLGLCAMSDGDRVITPFVYVTKNKTDERTNIFLKNLSEIYPIGMVEKVWL